MRNDGLHVLVAGGGIGGLCLAQALRQADISVAVYERDSAPRARLDRYRLHINPAGSRSLRACLAPEAWEWFLATTGRTGGGFGFLTEQLETMVVVEDDLMYPPATDPAEQWYPADRATLRDVLLSGLDGTVSFGKALKHYETAPGGGVTACFADGSHATSDILVGADGTHSQVREQLVPGTGPAGIGAAGIGQTSAHAGNPRLAAAAAGDWREHDPRTQPILPVHLCLRPASHGQRHRRRRRWG